jgi:hypothetical protein
VTQLYRAANRLIKTLYIARTAMQEGNDSTALLNYNEVATIFHEKRQFLERHGLEHGPLSKNLAICYNNIACILVRQQDFSKHALYFEQAISLSGRESVEDRFKLACRLYNYGYGLYRQFMQVTK